MIIGDFDIEGIPVDPFETNSLFIVDPDAVLPGTITLQSFQTIPGRYPYILQLYGIFKETQFSSRHFMQITGKAFGPLPIPNTLREHILETLDHAQ
jgi:hypothetical protein